MSFLNYTPSANLTSFPAAMNYTNQVMQVGTGVAGGFFGPLVLMLCFMGFFAVSGRFTSDRALPYSLFMTSLVSFILTSIGILDPIYMLLCIVLLGLVVYRGGVE